MSAANPDPATSSAAAASASAFVVASGLVKRYPGVVALNHADLTITPGIITGLLGKNGAGKSTMIKVLAGAVAPDEGELRIDGAPTRLHGPLDATRRGFSFVHQELTDVPSMTVAENIELGLGYPKRAGVFVNRRALRFKASEALERLGAKIDPKAKLAGLSIAERRMVAIARGLATNARLLVLDEPTASFTETEIVHLHDVVRLMRDSGVAVIYVTHRLQEVFTITDRVLVMRDGEMVFSSPTTAVDRATLIEQITGHPAAMSVQPWRPTGRAEDREELLRVEDLALPGVVEPASFALRSGDLLGIAGLVGAGRTELARLIFGADRAASGRILVRGEPVRIRGPRDAMHAGIALLPEDRRNQGTVLTFSVRKNITLATMERFRLRGPFPLAIPSGTRERKAAQEAIHRLQIKVADAEHPIRMLSGGNQQKVVLAKCVASAADILIFDEPTHGIDVHAKEEIYRLVIELAAAGKGVIFISSEFPELVGICNRVIVMREGLLVGELSGDAITESALIKRCYAAA